MSTYVGNDLEDRLKISETENAALKKMKTINWYMELIRYQTYM